MTTLAADYRDRRAQPRTTTVAWGRFGSAPEPLHSIEIRRADDGVVVVSLAIAACGRSGLTVDLPLRRTPTTTTLSVCGECITAIAIAARAT